MSARYPADRNPMSSARRDFVHGKLQPAEKAGLSDWALRAYCVGIFIIGVVFAFHAASDVTPPTSMHSTSAPVEAGSGGKVSR